MSLQRHQQTWQQLYQRVSVAITDYLQHANEVHEALAALRSQSLGNADPTDTLLATNTLQCQHLPHVDTTVQQLIWFCNSFNGYAYVQQHAVLGVAATAVSRHYYKHQQLPSLSIRELRAFLFFEIQAFEKTWMHEPHPPTPHYLYVLLGALKAALHCA